MRPLSFGCALESESNGSARQPASIAASISGARYIGGGASQEISDSVSDLGFALAVTKYKFADVSPPGFSSTRRL